MPALSEQYDMVYLLCFFLATMSTEPSLNTFDHTWKKMPWTGEWKKGEMSAKPLITGKSNFSPFAEQPIGQSVR